MSIINRIFDRMDEWRHLPNYQLERRADLFFSVYLPEALERRFGAPVVETLVPEFPVRIGSIYPDIPINESYKIDYVAFTQDLSRAIFVELKTDDSSRRTEQDKYLAAAREVGMPALLGGLLQILQATGAKRKYIHLLCLIESIGLLRLPREMRILATAAKLRGVGELAKRIEITCPVESCEIVYLQPTGNGPDVLNFSDFSAVVRESGDAFSLRFADSLLEWAAVEAGKKPPSSCSAAKGGE
jgi:hypothetical protein